MAPWQGKTRKQSEELTQSLLCWKWYKIVFQRSTLSNHHWWLCQPQREESAKSSMYVTHFKLTAFVPFFFFQLSLVLVLAPNIWPKYCLFWQSQTAFVPFKFTFQDILSVGFYCNVWQKNNQWFVALWQKFICLFSAEIHLPAVNF